MYLFTNLGYVFVLFSKSDIIIATVIAAVATATSVINNSGGAVAGGAWIFPRQIRYSRKDEKKTQREEIFENFK